MFRGYKLSLQTKLSESNRLIGLHNNSVHQQAIKQKLQTFSSEKILDGAMLEAEWFPQINANVFISHSHLDEEIALSFAGWLDTNFGINAFVDSAVWKNAKDLLKQVDDRLCIRPDTGNYDYEKRNRTTAHIHMMLNAALMKMMDRTECFFLINTPNSISTSNVVEETYSPWLYAELSMSKLLRIKPPVRPIFESREFAKGGEILNKAQQIMKHRADTRHLLPLNAQSLTNWKNLSATQDRMNALDILYFSDDSIGVKPKSILS